jgi:NAD(P)-dependent dehydrogenase (short-subunit alcohol dehydrogenase family)
MAAGGNPEAAQRHIEGYLPMGYIGDPVRDIGNMALYLASDESRYITGTEMVVDGGMITGLPG